MIRLKGITLKNVVSFKDATVAVEENNGFVVVNGINHDSNIANNSNGAGKSLFWSALPTAAYEADPLSLTKKNKKDLHGTKGSSIAIDFLSNEGKHVQLDQIGAKYKVYLDGEDQKAQKGDIARGIFGDHWTLRQEEFYTTAYIQSQRPCDFQKAKPSERLNFITNLFDLHFYDQIRAYFSKRKQAIKEKEIEFGSLSAQLDSVERSLGKTGWSAKKNKELKSLRAKAEAASSKLEQLYQELNDAKSDFKALDKLVKALKFLAKASKPLTKYNSDIHVLEKELEADLILGTKLEDYEQAVADHKKKVAKLNAAKKDLLAEVKALKLPKKQKALGVKLIRKALREIDEAFSKVKSDYSKLSAKLEEQIETIDEADGILDKLKSFGFKKVTDVDLETDVSDEMSMLSTVIELYQELEDHSECPTCNQKINQAKLKTQAKKAEKRLPKLKQLKQAQKLVHAYNELQESITDTTKLEKELEALNVMRENLKKESKKLSELEEIVSSLDEIDIKLDSITVPVAPKGKLNYPDLDSETVDKLIEDIDDYFKQFDRLSQLFKSITSIGKDELKSIKSLCVKLEYKKAGTKLKTHLASMDSSISEYEDSISELNASSKEQSSKLVALESAKSNWSLLTEQKHELDTKLSKSRPIIEEKKIVETLYGAFGNTNLKLRQATKILKIIEANLNNFSHMVFPETMVFKLDAGTQGIDAVVTRKNGLSSDISKLSGAETNCFRLLFAISILPLVPANRRTNFMILDEPDSACSDAVREHLAKEFIPKLRSLVPHIFWITPKSTDIFSECELWTIEKRNGVSSINSGKTHEKAQ